MSKAFGGVESEELVDDDADDAIGSGETRVLDELSGTAASEAELDGSEAGGGGCGGLRMISESEEAS